MTTSQEPVVKRMTWGMIPPDLDLDEPFDMTLNSNDESVVCDAINQGIDSHLEAIFFDDHGIVDGHHRRIGIKDGPSMRCLLRRLVEMGNTVAEDLASAIMTTLGYEWV